MKLVIVTVIVLAVCIVVTPAVRAENADWGDVAGRILGNIFLGAEKGIVFYAFDSLAYPGQPVNLCAKLQEVKMLSPVSGVTVAFDGPSGRVGEAKTDGKGLACIRWTPPRPGDYNFTAKITKAPEDKSGLLSGLTPASVLIAARQKDVPFVVIDLDRTVVNGNFFVALMGGAKPMPYSVRVTNKLAGRYGICYLTHRPDLLTDKSKSWLKGNGYPQGVVLVSEIKEAFADSGKYKTATLKMLTKAYPNTKIGIGDKISDARAYIANGMTAYLLPYVKDEPEDMLKLAWEIRRADTGEKLQVVSDWRQIEQGIFEGKRFPAKTFCDKLIKQASLKCIE
jgi:hypothetical protein